MSVGKIKEDHDKSNFFNLYLINFTIFLFYL